MMLGTEAERANGDGWLMPGLGTAIDCLSASSNAVQSAAEYPQEANAFQASTRALPRGGHERFGDR